MYNSEGNQQMYSAQGSPQVFTPNGTRKSYRTPALSPEMYSTQGNRVSVEQFQNERPAFLSKNAEERYWKERSPHGFPVGASEWENKFREKQKWVANDPSFVPIDFYPTPPEVVQDPTFVPHTTPTNFRGSTVRENKAWEKPAIVPGGGGCPPPNTSNKGCFYTANGEISCPK